MPQIDNNHPRIVVIGDYMTDIWWCVTPQGASQDSGCPRYGAGDVIEMPGGAGNVAKNLSLMGAEVLQIGESTPKSHRNCKHRLYTVENRTQVVRWDENDYSEPIYTTELGQILDFDPHLIIISDYAKGAVTNEVVQWLLTRTRTPLFVDTKRGPRQYTAFTDRELVLFPNMPEYLAEEELYNTFPSVLLKKGRLGAELLDRGRKVAEAPATCPHPKSTCGAGDIVIATTAYLAAQQSPVVLDRGQANLEHIMTIVGESIDASNFTCQIKEIRQAHRINPYSRGRT